MADAKDRPNPKWLNTLRRSPPPCDLLIKGTHHSLKGFSAGMLLLELPKRNSW